MNSGDDAKEKPRESSQVIDWVICLALLATVAYSHKLVPLLAWTHIRVLRLLPLSPAPLIVALVYDTTRCSLPSDRFFLYSVTPGLHVDLTASLHARSSSTSDVGDE